MLHLVRLNEMRPRVEASVRSAGVTAPIRSLCDDVRRGSEVVLVGTVAKVGYDDDCILTEQLKHDQNKEEVA